MTDLNTDTAPDALTRAIDLTHQAADAVNDDARSEPKIYPGGQKDGEHVGAREATADLLREREERRAAKPPPSPERIEELARSARLPFAFAAGRGLLVEARDLGIWQAAVARADCCE